MSQQIGKDFPTRIPVFGDDASIQEAFSVYHFGVDNYTSQPIPDNSIEGHFRSLNARVSANESAISGLGQTFIEEVSTTSRPNVIAPQASNIVPLTIRAIQNQSAVLQRWQNIVNSAPVDVVNFFPGGAASFNSYLNIGATTQSLTTALNISIGNQSDKGIVVRAAVSQQSNMQEWLASNGTTILARVDNVGRLYSQNIQVSTTTGTETLTNKTLTSPIINAATIANSTINSPTISGGTINGATEIILAQALPETNVLTSRVRNITISTSGPFGGNDGDLWVRYLN
jgi:hypothetical protein